MKKKKKAGTKASPGNATMSEIFRALQSACDSQGSFNPGSVFSLESCDKCDHSNGMRKGDTVLCVGQQGTQRLLFMAEAPGFRAILENVGIH